MKNSRPPTALGWMSLALLLGLTLSACSSKTIKGIAAVLTGGDFAHSSFINSIPFRGDPSKNPVVHVYIGIDGLSYHAAREALRRGAFSRSEMNLSKFITMFPGTSDASWTRIMHTEKLGGYEMEYYDPHQDEVHNKGLMGVAKHIMPALSDEISFEAKYLQAFDYRANGYTHSMEAYRNTAVSYADSVDNLFFLLGGRAETRSVFSAYILELDVMGHMSSFDDVVEAVLKLAARIEKFKADHPERQFRFTLFSDHGMDYIQVPQDRLVEFGIEMKKVGVNPVERFAGHDPAGEVFAIPIEHTRVTYLALHTPTRLVPEVSTRLSKIPSVDLVVSRLSSPPEPLAGNPAAQKDLPGVEWFGIYSEGQLAVHYGFDRFTDQYHLPAGQAYERIGMSLSFEAGESVKILSDDELFARTSSIRYPDLFYRIRTGLSPIGVKFPADVLVSFRPTWVEVGFRMPIGGDDIATQGFHGSLEELGTLGTLLTDEREVPDAVRSDTFLELFPRMKDHMISRGVKYVEGDPNASLDYEKTSVQQN